MEARNRTEGSSLSDEGSAGLGLQHRQDSRTSDAQSTMSSIVSPTPLVEDGTDAPRGLDATSATFHPGLEHDGKPTDLTLVSFDNILFYAHSSVLRDASENAFGGIIPPAGTAQPSLPEGQTLHTRILMLESSAVVEVMLFVIYDLPFVSPTSPSESALFGACQGLTKYGIPVARYLVPGHPLYSAVVAFTPTRPMEVYVLAAEHDAHELARAASSHLLSLNLARMGDEVVPKLGPYYLRRLFLLHIDRVKYFQGLLRGVVPSEHPPTPSCSLEDQATFQRKWFLATSYLAWDAQPDTTVATLTSRLEPVGARLSCALCQDTVSSIIAGLQSEWLKVKDTIE